MPLITAIFLTFASCKPEYFTDNGSVWGTTYHIVYRADRPLSDSIRGVMAQVDSTLSLFNPVSEVSAVNAGRTGTVGRSFADVMAVSKAVHALSGGRFDPTVAPLANLWGFGPDDTAAAPDSLLVARTLAIVGLDRCSVEFSPAAGCYTVHKPEGMRFDFSAVAKGYGVDCIADMLERNGCSDYMVEVGGEVVAAGTNPRGESWRIQVDAPVADVLHSRLTVIALGPERSALASSGNYRNYRTDSLGNRYGHTINPTTGYPVQTSVLAATVAAGSCAYADALATACMTLEPDSALAMLERAGARGILVTAVADTFAVTATEQFP